MRAEPGSGAVHDKYQGGNMARCGGLHTHAPQLLSIHHPISEMLQSCCSTDCTAIG